MSSIDYNVNNYTITELFIILDLDDPTTDEILQTTNAFINRFSSENQPNLVSFFESIQTKLITYMDQLENSGIDAEYTPDSKQTDTWYKNEALPQNNTVQTNKITDRIEKVDIYDNNHMPMKREQLGVTNNFAVPVAQDTLNPNLENTTSRFINLDSQFRQAAGGTESMSTDYTLDLSDPLTNVLNLRLYSVQIPYTWYTIDYIYGNTCLWVTNNGNTFKIFIEPGNYSPTDFCVAIQNAFTTLSNFQPPYVETTSIYTTAFTNAIIPTPQIATYNANNGKILLQLNGWSDPAGNAMTVINKTTDIFNVTNDSYYTFFDFTGSKTCYNQCVNNVQGQTFDGTLGWLMGFRLPVEPIYSVGNIPTAVLNLAGPKYLILVLDDFNQNHINNGLITITELSKSLAMPTYYNYSQPYICSPVPNLGVQMTNISGNLSGIGGQTAPALGVNPENLFNSLQDKLNFGLQTFPQILPSAPRTLTQAQIYTVNEIIKNRSKTISFRSKAPTTTDTFALLPIKYGNMKTGDIYVEFSGSVQDNKRIYFGPVNIDRMRITLLDDRGNVLDLHGGEWSITLISQNLYQY
jgi:hypothetical protein